MFMKDFKNNKKNPNLYINIDINQWDNIITIFGDIQQ